jgi:hypothetical protein
MTTPPQTPRSAASSVSGIGMKRGPDGGAASESEKEDAGGSGSQQGPTKKRRIAPTLVSDSK